MNLEELERLAREATPGPWQVSHAGEGDRNGFRITEYYVRLPGADFALAADVVDADMKPSEVNAAYIAACSPETVLRLVSIAKAAESLIRLAQTEPLADADRRGMLTEAAYQNMDALTSSLRAALIPVSPV